MSEQQRIDTDEKGDNSWVTRLRQLLKGQKGGDVIVGTVGQGVRGVAVGKNIIQIGTVVIPTLPVLALVLVLGGLIFAITFYANIFSPPPTPTRMTGLFNVAVANFGEVDDPATGAPRESEDGKLLADQVFEKLHTRLNEIPELAGDVELQHEYIGFIPGDTLEARQQAASELAQQINADVVIYGYLDTSRLPPEFVAEFCISPRLTGAEESTGANAFGSTIPLKLPLKNADNRAKLKDELIPRLEALTEFMFGLAFFKAGEPDLALQQLELARTVPQWKDKQGKEILYLWIGSTVNQRALEKSEAEGAACPIEGHEHSNDWECARAAFEKALGLKPNFARAYIGLGNLWLDQAEQTRGGQTFYICNAYDRAVEEYRKALDPAMEAAPKAYAKVKSYYNIGLAYATAYRNGCGDEFYSPAVDNLSLAISAYENNPEVLLVCEIGAKTFYQLGLVHKKATKYDAAVEAFTQTIAVAEADDAYYEEDWQSIRWYACDQMGHAHSALAEAGDSARWQDAIKAYRQVVGRYEEGKFGNEAVVSDAYYGLGTAYIQTGQHAEALEPLEISIRLAGLAAGTEPEPWQSLRWAGYLELGKALAALAEESDPARWAEALAAYGKITAQFESGAQDVPGSLAAEAECRAGLAHEALGDTAQAKASYEKAVATEGADPNIVTLAQERLQALGTMN